MEISLNSVVMMVVVGSLFFVAVATLFSRFLEATVEDRLKQKRVTCRLCGAVFVSEYVGVLVHCDDCDRLNLHRRNGPLG